MAQPKPAPPVNNPGAGKITVIVSGRSTVKSSNPGVVVIRKE